MELFFDTEFRSLIPLLTQEERIGLEDSLKREGNRDPIVIWKEKRLMLDGHNRYDICDQHSIPLKPALELSFADRDAAKIWIIRNQFDRRNLSPYSRTVLALKLGELLRTKARETQLATIPQKGQQGFQPVHAGPTLAPHERTREQVAVTAHVSHGTVDKVKVLEAKATPEQREKLVNGGASINEVYTLIKRQEKETKRETVREVNRELVQCSKPLTSIAAVGIRYQAIVIDPPWDWGDEGDCDQFGRARPTYKTMSIDEITVLPVSNLAADNAHLYLWITNRSMPKGFRLLDAWGFRFVTILTWVKPFFGMGNYFKGSTEHVLFGIRGSLPLLRNDVGTHFAAPRQTLHSEKPDAFYSLVESCSPGPWLEMFSRKQRNGWVTWGGEV